MSSDLAGSAAVQGWINSDLDLVTPWTQNSEFLIRSWKETNEHNDIIDLKRHNKQIETLLQLCCQRNNWLKAGAG